MIVAEYKGMDMYFRIFLFTPNFAAFFTNKMAIYWQDSVPKAKKKLKRV